MSEALWNFASVEAGARDIADSVSAVSSLLDRGKDSLAGLAAVWGGPDSPAYQQLQALWDGTSDELNAALQELARAIAGEAEPSATPST